VTGGAGGGEGSDLGVGGHVAGGQDGAKRDPTENRGTPEQVISPSHHGATLSATPVEGNAQGPAKVGNKVGINAFLGLKVKLNL
jgi:hypothetical protein